MLQIQRFRVIHGEKLDKHSFSDNILDTRGLEKEDFPPSFSVTGDITMDTSDDMYGGRCPQIKRKV